MKVTLVGNKNNNMAVTGLNIGTSTIPAGGPVFLGALFAAASALTDPTGVVCAVDAATLATANATLAASATAQNFGMIGVALQSLVPNQYGDIAVYGIVNVALAMQTRSASTATWISWAGIVSGTAINLGVETTVGKYFTTGGNASVATQQQIFALDIVASAAGSASATSDTRTLISSSIRAFVRMM